MKNKFRLSASHYERETSEQRIDPKKVYYIAVEGNQTEKEYFNGLSQFRRELGIDALVDVAVLNRSNKDGHSAPDQVLELLEEYLLLRESSDDLSDDIPKEFLDSYGTEFIKTYLENPDSIPEKARNKFTNELRTVGYDINYRHYLNKYSHDTDEFCIMIDRDKQSHSEKDMRRIITHCSNAEHPYRCFIANPCFEFWLLLHLSNIKEEYADRLEDIKENHKISSNHTYVSNEVSVKAHHGKSGIKFKQNYLPHVLEAVERAKLFASSEDDLVNSIGCNLWKLIEDMRNCQLSKKAE